MTSMTALLGDGTQAPKCRVISSDISTHWWRNDGSGLCLCGETSHCEHVWVEQGGPGDEWHRCDNCGTEEDW
jgi:hypothetical protein